MQQYSHASCHKTKHWIFLGPTQNFHFLPPLYEYVIYAFVPFCLCFLVFLFISSIILDFVLFFFFFGWVVRIFRKKKQILYESLDYFTCVYRCFLVFVFVFVLKWNFAKTENFEEKEEERKRKRKQIICFNRKWSWALFSRLNVMFIQIIHSKNKC